MASDRVVVVDEHGPRRPRRRRVLIGVHAAVLASIVLTSGALADRSSSGSDAKPPSTAPKAIQAAPYMGAHHGCHRKGAMRHSGEGTVY